MIFRNELSVIEQKRYVVGNDGNGLWWFHGGRHSCVHGGVDGISKPANRCGQSDLWPPRPSMPHAAFVRAAAQSRTEGLRRAPELIKAWRWLRFDTPGSPQTSPARRPKRPGPRLAAKLSDHNPLPKLLHPSPLGPLPCLDTSSDKACAAIIA